MYLEAIGAIVAVIAAASRFVDFSEVFSKKGGQK